MLFFKSMGKRLSANIWLVAVFAFVLIIAFMLTSLLFINRSVNSEVFSIEKRSAGKIRDAAYRSFEQIQKLNVYFSTSVLMGAEDQMTGQEAMWRQSFLEKISFARATVSSAEYIWVKRGNVSFNNPEGGFIEPNPENPDVKLLGILSNATIYSTDYSEYKYGLYFVIKPQSGDYSRNDVVIGVNTTMLAKESLEKYEYDRKEYVVDAEGTVILTTSMNALYENIFDLNGISHFELKDESKKIKTNGGDYFWTVEKINGLDMYIVTLTDQSVYSSYYSAGNRNVVFISVLLLIIILTASPLIIRQTYKPMREVIESIDSLSPFKEIANRDEVRYITDCFTRLYSANDELNRSVEEIYLLLSEQQAKALQAQICPHFLYNTLDAINWAVYDMEKQVTPVSSCINSMAYFLQSSMDMSSLFLKVCDEVILTQKYIDILMFRYNSKLEVLWDVQEDITDYVVLKICIQPAIENAIQHGKPKAGVIPSIRISIKKIASDLVCTISDNGEGIPSDKLAELNAYINDMEELPREHIGLKNINMRLKLLYGKKYGVGISSSSSGGTACKISMPAEKI